MDLQVLVVAERRLQLLRLDYINHARTRPCLHSLSNTSVARSVPLVLELEVEVVDAVALAHAPELGHEHRELLDRLELLLEVLRLNEVAQLGVPVLVAHRVQLEELLVQVAALCTQDQVRTIVVDSIINLCRTEFNGRGELAERQQRLKTFLSRLDQNVSG